MTKEITSNTFKNEVLSSDIPVVVDFYADWCGPCTMMSPVLDSVADKLKGKVKFVKINIEQNPEVTGMYNIRSLPTLILFKNGQVANTKIGFTPYDAIHQFAVS
jgi:thioredoxin 1